jgi:hypothetical protein
MPIRMRIPVAIALTLVAASLAAFGVATGFGTYSDQGDNAGNAFSSAPSFTNTGYQNPSAQAATTGGDNNGFELNPTYAYGDGPLYATNVDGPGDRHLYYNYGLAPPSDSTIEGIRVRLDWWLDAVAADNSMSVELSWDGGTNWTLAKTDTVESAAEHTGIVGGAGDTWGRIWTVAELGNANFRVRLTCTCTGGAECDGRDFYLDWVAVNAYYTPP